MSNKARFIRIEILENGKKKLAFTLPLFLISGPLRLIPKRFLQKYTGEDIDIKGLIKEIKSEGKGTRINLKEDENQVLIILK